MKLLEYTIKLSLLFLYIFIVFFNLNMGLADNGDYSRSISLFSSGPSEFLINWPAEESEEWKNRFFNFWIPTWNFNWNLSLPHSSVIFLWMPSILLNEIFYSKTELYLPYISLFPKLILFLFLISIFRKIDRTTKSSARLILYLTLVFPLILIFTTTDYIVYFNSFYQESASFIYLFLVILSIVLFIKNPQSLLYFSTCTIALLLLSTSKASSGYWPALVMPLLVFIKIRASNNSISKNLITLAGGIVFTVILSIVSLIATDRPHLNGARYHGLYYGALTFSQHPDIHIKRLGYGNENCINRVAYLPTSEECVSRYANKVSLTDILSIYLLEPPVFIETFIFSANKMQDISLDYLGKYSRNHPDALSSLAKSHKPFYRQDFFDEPFFQDRYWSKSSTSKFNLWSYIKFHTFPTGNLLFVTLAIWIVWFIQRLISRGKDYPLAAIGLLVSVACVVDMFLVIFGAGKFEVIKHLFLANVLFDMALLAFLNSLLIQTGSLYQKLSANHSS